MSLFDSALYDMISDVMRRGLIDISPNQVERLYLVYRDGLEKGVIPNYQVSKAEHTTYKILNYMLSNGVPKQTTAAFLNALQEVADRHGWGYADPVLKKKADDDDRNEIIKVITDTTKTIGDSVGNVVGGVTAPLTGPITWLAIAAGVLGLGYLAFKFGGKK